MPTLNWIGKDAVVNHHLHVPFQLLKDVPDLACGEPGDGNLIVQGDNLVALRIPGTTPTPATGVPRADAIFPARAAD